MLFDTLNFFLFFSIVYIIYLFSSCKKQNILLLLASYFFYACWDWRFLILLFSVSAFAFFVAKIIEAQKEESLKKLCLILAIFLNLTILIIFKYLNFFFDTFSTLLIRIGVQVELQYLNILLPVGISFYIFQALSYIVDVYQSKVRSCQSLLEFALYISFFPQLVAGPIERASDFIPQIQKSRRISFENLSSGFYLILWGLFLKVYTADNLAIIVDQIFDSQTRKTGPMILMGCYCFAFQIYCDFNGYSTIARGIAKLMGFELSKNFAFPYFSTNPRDFWRSWHISLSRWLRDYLYIPLGGSKDGAVKTIRNLIITMSLGGLWHGASFNYILWGLYHGILLAINNVIIRGQVSFKNVPISKTILKCVIYFHITCFGWLLFRTETFYQLQINLLALFSGWNSISILGEATRLYNFLFYVSPVLAFDVLSYKTKEECSAYALPLITRTIIYVIYFYLFAIYANNGNHEFIYFQF